MRRPLKKVRTVELHMKTLELISTDELEAQLAETCIELARARAINEQTAHALRRAQAEKEQLLASITSILILIDADSRIIEWNQTATDRLGISRAQALGKHINACGVEWDLQEDLAALLAQLSAGGRVSLADIKFMRPDGTEGVLGFTISRFGTEFAQRLLLFGADITERRALESQLRQAQKLESIGQLAAGVAHEINTPTQYVGDNIRFLREAHAECSRVFAQFGTLLTAVETGAARPALAAEVRAVVAAADLEYLNEEIPRALQQSLEGVECIAKIVQSMKVYAHPGTVEKQSVDLNKAIESTVTVARNEWKYVADVQLELDAALPPVPCLLGEFTQVMVNLIVNAAHAIADRQAQGGAKGTITISTRQDGAWAEVRIADTGTGIPEHVRAHIFNPFFTTKEVGRGTGQGLSISHAVIVEKHDGTISFETETGQGTTFIIRLPLDEAAE